MPERLRDRYDVSDLRFTREDCRTDRLKGILNVLDSIFPNGSVFHVFVDTPDQDEDLIEVLIDGATMVRFDLPRNYPYPSVGIGPPVNVEIKPFAIVRQNAGQEARKRLDRAALDALKLLG